MKKVLPLLLLPALAISTQAAAESFVANAGFTSDYVFRGESRTEDGLNPAVFGGLDYVADTGAYAGIWVSNSADLNEVDAYVGIALQADQVVVDIGAVGYFFPQSSAKGDEKDVTEAYIGVHYRYFQGYYWQNVEEDQGYLDANIIYPFYSTLSMELHVGHRLSDDREGVDEQTDARVSLDFKGWKLSVSHTDKEDDNPRFYVGKRFDFTIL